MFLLFDIIFVYYYKIEIMRTSDLEKLQEADSSDEPDCYNDLSKILPTTWQFIEEGVHRRDSAAHTPALCTIGIDGHPNVRSMVLRAANRGDRTLVFHTDNRSSKIREILSSSRASVLFYDAKEKIQLRLKCELSIYLNDKQTKERWNDMQEMSRICYQTEFSPGEVIDFPQTQNRLADGFSNFAVLEARIYCLEWLYLSSKGNRRAIFRWTTSGEETKDWLVP